ncbi:hypothetical protein [Streptomyces xiamenensis]|uniref:hypothetical protein n=1 Tax=Streptomyces xiamenensis TaxID=408015 RepID=UPI0035D95C9E
MIGHAESEEPIILPMEAIELDAFRRRHVGDTFWCGLLLGGCGARLSSKLYTDRVCHFSHIFDPTGVHVCDRRSRDIASADHLYVRQAAIPWLKARGQQAEFHYTQPGGAPIGAVVDITWESGEGSLRVHLDDAVPPAWDDTSTEPVLGMSVPVDDDTLVRRWYVHRIRFDSVGTARQVQIGTQAFARETTWFGIDECEMTPQGLRTPAVERIIRDRGTRPAAVPFQSTRPSRPAQQPDPVRRLAGAIESGARFAVLSARQDVLAQLENGVQTPEHTAVLEAARTWLAEQSALRADLFGRLKQAVTQGDPADIRRLLKKVAAEAGTDRYKEEIDVLYSAERFLEQDQRRTVGRQRMAQLSQQRRPRHRSSPPPPRGSTVVSQHSGPPKDVAAHLRVKEILSDLRRTKRQPGRDLRRLTSSLARALKAAGDRVTPRELADANAWIAKGQHTPGDKSSTPPARGQRNGRGPGSAPRERRPSAAPPARLPDDALPTVAATLRTALAKAARGRTTESWPRLRRQLGTALPALSREDQLRVLAAVDEHTPADEPLLCAQLAATDAKNAQLYAKLAARLGRHAPPPTDAHMYWQTQVLRLQQTYRHR